MKRIEENMFCPLCGHPTTQRLRHVHNIREAGDWSSVDGAPIYKDVNYYIGICRQGKGLLLYSTEKPEHMEGEQPENLEILWPDPGILPDSVPAEVRRYYVEAKKVQNYNANDFVFKVRQALEVICAQQGVGSYKDKPEAYKPLHEKIKDLVEQNHLPPVIERMMFTLKELGNIGTHPGVNIDPRLVPDIDMFFRAVVQYVYIVPSRLDEILTNINELKKSSQKEQQ
jgi:hypothetical protein